MRPENQLPMTTVGGVEPTPVMPQAQQAMDLLNQMRGEQGELRPQTRQERMDRYRGFISNFMFTLGSGMREAANTAGGARRRTQAGVGASLMAPEFLRQAREKMASERALEEQRIAAANKSNLTLPLQLLQMITGAQRTQAQTKTEEARPPLINAQTGLADANAGLAEARTATEQERPGLINAQTDLANAQANRAKFMTVPGRGLFDLSGGQPTYVEGTDPNDRIIITAGMVERFGLPESAEGEYMRIGDLNAMIRALKPDRDRHTIVRLKDGVYDLNYDTGDKERLGDLPPTGAMTALGTVMTDNQGNILGRWKADGSFEASPLAGARKGPDGQPKLTREEVLNDLLWKLNVLEEAARRHPMAIGGAYGIIGRGVSFITNTGLLNDEEISTIYQLSEDLSDRRIRERTGAVVNAEELRRITRFSPNARTQTTTQFWSNVANMRREVEEIMRIQTTPKPVTPTTPASPAAPKPESGQVDYRFDPATGRIIRSGVK